MLPLLTALVAALSPAVGPSDPLVVQWSAVDSVAARALLASVDDALRRQGARSVSFVPRWVADPAPDCAPKVAASGDRPARVCVSLDERAAKAVRVRLRWSPRVGDPSALVESVAHAGSPEALATFVGAWITPRIAAVSAPEAEPSGRSLAVVTDTSATAVYIEHADGTHRLAGRVSPQESLTVRVPADAAIRCSAAGRFGWWVRPKGSAAVACRMTPVDDILLATSNVAGTRVWLDDALLGGWRTLRESSTWGPSTIRGRLPAHRLHARAGLTPGPHRVCAHAPGHARRCWVFMATVDRRPDRIDIFLPPLAATPRPPIPELADERPPVPTSEPAPPAAPAVHHPALWAGVAAGRSGGVGRGSAEVGVEWAVTPGGSAWGVTLAGHLAPALDAARFGWGLDLGGIWRPAAWHVVSGLGLRERGQPYQTVGRAAERLYVFTLGGGWSPLPDIALRLGVEFGFVERRSQAFAEGRESIEARLGPAGAMRLGVAWRL